MRRWAYELGLILLVNGAGAAACALLTGCPQQDPMTPLDHLQIGEETLDEAHCVDMYADAGRAKVDECRAKVSAAWNGYWGVVFTDAGPVTVADAGGTR